MDRTPPTDPILETFMVVSLAKRLALSLLMVGVYCAIVGVVARRYQLHLHEMGLESGMVNSVILGLLLGFRNRAAYDRWWEARRLWGQLTNDIRNLSCQLSAFLPDAALVASPIVKLLIGFPKALKLHLRGDKPRLQDIPGFAEETDDPGHVPLYLSGRVYSQIARWEREGLIDQGMLLTLAPHLSGLMDVCGGCERIRSTPLSPCYKGLLRTGIALNILIAPWYTMSEVGFWGIPTLLLVSFFFLGVELVDTIIEEPFGRERDDLALDTYYETIYHSILMHLPAAAQPDLSVYEHATTAPLAKT